MSYTRNLANNIKFAFPKMILNQFQGFTGVKEMFEQDYAEPANILKDAFSTVEGEVSSVFKTAKDNTFESLKSGNLVDYEAGEKDQAKALGMDFGDMDDMFGDDSDMDSMFDDDDDDQDDSDDDVDYENADNVEIGEINNNNVTNAPSFVRTGGSTVNNSVLDSGLSDTVKTTSGTMIAANSLSTKALAEVTMSGFESIFNVITDQTSQDRSFYDQTGQALSVVTGALATLDERLEKIQEVSSATAERNNIFKKEKSISDEISLDDVLSETGSINVSTYSTLLADRLKKTVSDGSMFKQAAGMFTRPLNMLADKAMEVLVNKTGIGKPLRDLGKSFSNLPNLLFNKLSEIEKRSDTKFSTKILKPIAAFLNVKKDETGGSNLGKYEKGPIPFDGITKKSIVEVIPSLLAKILSAVKKDEETLIYDYDKGTFTDTSVMRKKIEDSERTSVLNDNDVIKNALSNTEEFRNMDSESRSKFEERLSIQLGEMASKGSFFKDGYESDGTDVGDFLARQSKTLSVGQMAEMNNQLMNSRKNLYDTRSNLTEAERTFLATDRSKDLTTELDRTKAKESESEEIDPTTGEVKGKAKLKLKDITDADYDSTNSYKKKRFGDDLSTEFSVKSLADLPGKLVARASNTINDAIGKIFFGRGKGAKEDGEESLLDKMSSKMSNLLASTQSMFSKAIFGEDAFNEDGSPKDPKSGLKGEGSLFGNILGSIKNQFGKFTDWMGGIFKNIGSFIDAEIFTPMKGTFNKISGWFSEELFAPLKSFFTPKEGEEGFMSKFASIFQSISDSIRNKLRDIFSGFKDKFSKIFMSSTSFLFGKSEVDADGNVIGKDGLFTSFKNSLFTSILNPSKEFLFGKEELDDEGNVTSKAGIFTNLGDKLVNNILNPSKQFLFGDEELDADGNIIKKAGLFTNLGDNLNKYVVEPIKAQFANLSDKFRDNVFTPIKQSLFGKEEVDADGNVTSKAGMFTKVFDSFSLNLLNPAKKYLFGDDEDPTAKDGLFSRMGASILSVFNGGEEDENKLPFLDSVRNILDEKVLAPLSNYFMDPETGLLPKLGNQINENIFLPIKGFLVGDENDEEGGLFGKMGTWFNTKLFEPLGASLFGDDDNPGVFTKMENWFHDEISLPFKSFMFGEDGESGFFGDAKKSFTTFLLGDDEAGIPGLKQRVFDPAMEFVSEKILNPLKDTMSEMWGQAGNFLKTNIMDPLKGTLTPFIDEFKIQMGNLKEASKEALMAGFSFINDQFGKTFGASITDLMDTYILEPVKGVLDSARKMIGGILGKIFKAPVDLIRNASDKLRNRHKDMGRDYTTEEGKKKIADRMAATAARIKAIKDAAAEKAKTTAVRAKEAAEAAKEKAKISLERNRKKAKDKIKIGTEIATTYADKKLASITDIISKIGDKISQSVVSDPNSPEALPNKRLTTISSAILKIKDFVVSKDPDAGKSDEETLTKQTTSLATIEKETVSIHSFFKNNLQRLGSNVSKIVRLMKGSTDVDLNPSPDSDEGSSGGIFNLIKNLALSPIKLAKNLVVGTLKTIKDNVVGFVKGAFNIIATPFKLLKNLVGGVLDGLGKVAAGIGKAVGNVISGLGTILGSTVEVLSKTVGTIGPILLRSVGGIITGGTKLIGGIAKVAGESLALVGDFVTKGLLPAIGQVATGLVKLSGGLISATSSILSFGLSLVKGAFNKITGRGAGGAEGKISKLKLDGGFLDEVTKPLQVFVVGGQLSDSLNPRDTTIVPDESKLLPPVPPVEEEEQESSFSKIKTKITEAFRTNLDGMKEGITNVKDKLLTDLGAAKEGISTILVSGKEKFSQALVVAADILDPTKLLEKTKDITANLVSSLKGSMDKGKELAGGAAEIFKRKKEEVMKKKEAFFQARLVRNTGDTATSTGKITKSFSAIGRFFPIIIASLATMGGFLTKTLGGFLTKALAFFSLKKLSEGLGGDGVDTPDRRNRRSRRSSINPRNTGARPPSPSPSPRPTPKLRLSPKMLAPTAIAGMLGSYAGDSITSYADGIENETLSKVVGTGGQMLASGAEGAALGAMLGSIVPGLGTAVGAAVGGGIGALYGGIKHNWDSISGAAASMFLGNEAEYDEAGKVIKMPKSSLFGRMGESLFGKEEVLNKDGTVAREGGGGLFGIVGDGLNYVKDTAMKGVNGYVNGIKDSANWIKEKAKVGVDFYIDSAKKSSAWVKDKASAGLDFVTNKLKEKGEAIAEGWNKISTGVGKVTNFISEGASNLFKSGKNFITDKLNRFNPFSPSKPELETAKPSEVTVAVQKNQQKEIEETQKTTNVIDAVEKLLIMNNDGITVGQGNDIANALAMIAENTKSLVDKNNEVIVIDSNSMSGDDWSSLSTSQRELKIKEDKEKKQRINHLQKTRAELNVNLMGSGASHVGSGNSSIAQQVAKGN